MSKSKISYKSVVVQDFVTDTEKIKKYHREKLYNLSSKTIGNIPQLDEPTYDQKQWVLRKLKGSASIWRPCC